jgi:hypothetical protein
MGVHSALRTPLFPLLLPELELLRPLMNTQIRTVVTFNSSAFNTTQPKSYFINDCCFGDDERQMADR